jgi:hypothetical protein
VGVGVTIGVARRADTHWNLLRIERADIPHHHHIRGNVRVADIFRGFDNSAIASASAQ